MQNYALYMTVFTSEPFQQLPDRKVADVVVDRNGQVCLTYLNPAIKSPLFYQSLDKLQQIHCREGSKFKLLPEP